MATLEVTLSRAHKIVERLSDLIKDQNQIINDLAATKSFNTMPTESQTADLINRPAELKKAIDKYTDYVNAWATVRNVISKENQLRGIDAMLSMLESLKKTLAIYKTVVTCTEVDGYLPEEIDSYKPPVVPHYGMMLTVNPLRNKEFSENMKKMQNDFKKTSMQLSDKIAEANAARTTLELSEDIITAVTGL